MSSTLQSIIDLLKPFLAFTLLAIAVPMIVKFEVVTLGRNISEVSLTELVQQLFLLFAVIVFALSAKKLPQQRSFYVLVAGFFGCMLLREHDYYFDMIQHGFWFYPTITLAIGTIIYTFKNTEYFAASAYQFKATKAYIYILIGLVVILVFSRLFGTGGLWKVVMAADYKHHYKSTIQEGLELFGYAILFLGSIYQAMNIKHLKGESLSKSPSKEED